MIVALLSLSAGLGVAGCNPPPAGDVTATVTAAPGATAGEGTATFSGGTTITGTVPVRPDGTPTIVPSATCTPTPSPTPTPCPEPPTPTPSPKPIVILGCGAGNNPCGSSEYGLSQYKSWADNRGFSVYPEGFSDFGDGAKKRVANTMLSDIDKNPGKSVIFIGHSAGADAVLIALSKLPANIQVRAVALLDPTLSYSDSDGTKHYGGLNSIFTSTKNKYVGITAVSHGDNLLVQESNRDYTAIIAASFGYDPSNLNGDQVATIHNALASDAAAYSDVISYIESQQ